jgi:hypothetical protein
MMKAAIVAAIGISMTSAPVLAQSAAPLSVAHSAARAGATTQDESELRGGYIIPALIIIAIIAGVILLTGGDDGPSSP